jgi:HEAT repeat protein
MRALFASCVAVLLCHAAALAQDKYNPEPTPEESRKISAWMARLKDKDAEVRANAAVELAKFSWKAKAAVPALAQLLKDQNANVRAEAAETLSRTIGWSSEQKAIKAILPMLIEATKDPDARVCRGAVSALCSFQKDSEKRVPVFIDALKHPDDDVRRAAISGLDGSIHGSEAKVVVPALIGALKDKNARNRGWAVRALRYSFPEYWKAAVPGLASLLKDEERIVRSEAAIALAYLSDAAQDAVPALTETL